MDVSPFNMGEDTKYQPTITKRRVGSAPFPFAYAKSASQLFQASPGRRNIPVVFSDMQNDTPALDLEHARIVPTAFAMQKAEKDRLLPDLHGVEVHALGVDGAGKDVAYWQTLRDFWAAYFKRTGADLKSYSVLREPNSEMKTLKTFTHLALDTHGSSAPPLPPSATYLDAEALDNTTATRSSS